MDDSSENTSKEERKSKLDGSAASASWESMMKAREELTNAIE